jgi:hypothetical protein
MSAARKIIDLLHRAAEIFRSDPARNGNLLHLPSRGDIIVAGDLHNHIQNYEAVLRYADLAQNPGRMLLLQELIHGGMLGSNGEDLSFFMVVSALELIVKYPHRVHMILANHDLAQVQKIAVMKDGMNLTERFIMNVRLEYRGEAEQVLEAFAAFVTAMPLAAITVTGLLFTHSLPTSLATFDFSILRRALTEADYLRTGSVYQLIWGRKQTAEVLQAASKKWWADIFVCGHQQQDSGFGIVPPNMLIIDSSHGQGVLLPVDLARAYTVDDLARACVPISSIGRD